MSTASRKARKRADIPFTRAPKKGTPLLQRTHFVLANVRKQLRILDDHGFAKPEPKDGDK